MRCLLRRAATTETSSVLTSCTRNRVVIQSLRQQKMLNLNVFVPVTRRLEGEITERVKKFNR